jgi:rod shape-determining protein MreC
MKRNSWVAWVLAALILLLIFLSPSWSSDRLRVLLWAPPPSDYSELLAENQALKAENAAMRELERVSETAKTTGAVPAQIYSRYPLNFKNQILVNAGESAGVGIGWIAILPEKVLVGRVEQVFKNTALVRTVFDPGFRLAVRIGKAGADALLAGGDEPRLTLLPQGAEIGRGDVVYAADPALPYGLAVGEVGETMFSEDNLFEEAAVRLAYDLNGLRAVLLIPGK